MTHLSCSGFSVFPSLTWSHQNLAEALSAKEAHDSHEDDEELGKAVPLRSVH